MFSVYHVLYHTFNSIKAEGKTVFYGIEKPYGIYYYKNILMKFSGTEERIE